MRNERKLEIDWRPAWRAALDLIDWMLDVAARQVADFADDLARIEGVRDYLHGSVCGGPAAEVPVEDLLFVLGLFIAEVELDCGEPGIREVLGALEPALRGRPAGEG